MAMTECPHCGKQVSDKAVICPHCKERLIEEETIICSECGANIPKSLDTCPNCGAPINKEDVLQKVEVSKIATPIVNNKAKKFIVIGIICAVLIAGIVFAMNSNNKKQQLVNWQETYNSTVDKMLVGASEAESTASLIHSVWFNTIYKEADPKTNKYTFTERYRNDSSYTNETYARDSYFNDDFNDSLSVLFSSDTYQTSSVLITGNKEDVSKAITDLSKSIPEGKENAYEAINDLYDQYIGMVNLALSPTGNLNSYTSSFNQYDSDFMNAYNKAKNFME